MITLLKNGTLVDGSGDPPRRADVLISGRKIARIGQTVSRRHADRVLDVSGAIVSPGFIDVNAGPDDVSRLFADRDVSAYHTQGITTIVGGSGGISLAPLFSPSQFDATLKRGWRLEAHWDTMRSFFRTVRRRGIGINFGTAVGYASVSESVTRGALRDLSDRELEAVRRLLHESLSGGATGVSLCIGDSRFRNIAQGEIRMLLDICKDQQKPLVLCLGENAGAERDRVSAILKEASERGVSLRVSHAEPRRGGDAALFREVLAEHRRRETVHCDLTPSSFELVEGIDLIPPHWRGEPRGALHMRLLSSHAQEAERRYLTERLKDVRRITIARISDPALRFLEGKTVDAFCEARDLDREAGVAELLSLTRFEAALAFEDIQGDAAEAALHADKTLIVSPFCEEGEGMAVFLRHSFEKGEKAFANAVRQASALPAKIHGIRKRGLIREGYFADIVVLRENAPQMVLVNGSVILGGKEPSRAPSGMVVRD